MDKRLTRRLRWANLINKHYPLHFCWAELVAWAYSRKTIFALLWQYDRKKGGQGCRNASKDEETCYCGAWRLGCHHSQPEYVPPVHEEIPENQLPF